MSRAYYIDSSVLLGHLLQDPEAIPPETLFPAVTSSLTRVECLRSLERHLRLGRLSEDNVLAKREALFRILRSVRVAAMDDAILGRASESFQTHLRTLDAIHMATALRAVEETGETIGLATHDRRLATAARAYGFDVVGA